MAKHLKKKTCKKNIPKVPKNAKKKQKEKKNEKYVPRKKQKKEKVFPEAKSQAALLKFELLQGSIRNDELLPELVERCFFVREQSS